MLGYKNRIVRMRMKKVLLDSRIKWTIIRRLWKYTTTVGRYVVGMVVRYGYTHTTQCLCITFSKSFCLREIDFCLRLSVVRSKNQYFTLTWGPPSGYPTPWEYAMRTYSVSKKSFVDKANQGANTNKVDLVSTANACAMEEHVRQPHHRAHIFVLPNWYQSQSSA